MNDNEKFEIPPLPNAEDLEEEQHGPDFLQCDKWFDADIDEDWLPFDEPYKPPRWMLSHNDVPF